MLVTYVDGVIRHNGWLEIAEMEILRSSASCIQLDQRWNIVMCEKLQVNIAAEDYCIQEKTERQCTENGWRELDEENAVL